MPQLENGYLRLANELVEAYTRVRIPGEAMQCLWFIIRKTYGFGKLKDYISISQFSEATGLKRQHAHRGISKLIDMNIVTKKGDKYITSYCINKDYDTWKVVPKKVTSCPQKGDKSVPKKVNTKERIKDTIKDIKVTVPKKVTSCPSWLPMKEWNEFLTMRKKIKKPMTEYARTLAMTKLLKLKNEGSPPIEVLNQSIMGCYQGLFPLNSNKNDITNEPEYKKL